jgi:hypothetical protein
LAYLMQFTINSLISLPSSHWSLAASYGSLTQATLPDDLAEVVDRLTYLIST